MIAKIKKKINIDPMASYEAEQLVEIHDEVLKRMKK